MEIRLATMNDVPRIAEMYLDLRRHVHPLLKGVPKKVPSLEELLDYAKSKIIKSVHSIFLAIEDGKIVGMIRVTSRTKKKADLGDAYLEPAFRKQGVIQKIESYIIEHYKEHGTVTFDRTKRYMKQRDFYEKENLE
ncbi:MAG: GNAT family N-acetyltransferase [Promethearchaeota archaeon]